MFNSIHVGVGSVVIDFSVFGNNDLSKSNNLVAQEVFVSFGLLLLGSNSIGMDFILDFDLVSIVSVSIFFLSDPFFQLYFKIGFL